MSIPLHVETDLLAPLRPLRLVSVDVLRRRAEGYRPNAVPRPRRPWVQLVLLGVPTDATPAGVARVEQLRARRREWERLQREARARAARARELRQIAVDFPIGVRLATKDALARIGRDPDPDAPWEETPERIRRFADYFPDGMSFAEIGEVLGTRKQQVFKIYVRALRKMLEAMGADEERIREALQAEGTRSAWDAMLGG